MLNSSTHHTFIVWPPYLAKQTLLLISVFLLFYWLNLSLDSRPIKMMCGCSSQVDVFAAILDNSFKTCMDAIHWYCYWWNAVRVFATRWLSLASVFRSSMHRFELSLAADSLLKSTPNSVIHGINIRAIWRPHMRFNEVDVLFFLDIPSWSGQCALALHPAAVSTCNNDMCSDVRQQTLLEDDIAVVWAVSFRYRIDEDHPCLPHTRYFDRQHDVATWM